MNAKRMIAGLEALCAPDADLFFVTEDGEVFEIEGGLLDVENGTGRHGVLLTSGSQIHNGGF